MAGRRRTWLDGRVDVLLAALDEYGLGASVVSAAELIQERVQWVAAHLRVTPATARRYLTDEAVRDLARMMAVTVADEAPGADVLAGHNCSCPPCQHRRRRGSRSRAVPGARRLTALSATSLFDGSGSAPRARFGNA